jgi:hypothetical protein
LITDCTGGAWRTRAQAELGRRPTIEVQAPVDQTREHLATASLAGQARQLLSGAGMSPPAGKRGDYVLTGVLLSLHDGRPGQDDQLVQSYLLGLSLISATTGEKVWMDLFQLCKAISDARGPNPSVTLLQPPCAVDITGDFNAYDAGTISSRMARDIKSRPWPPGTVVLRFQALQHGPGTSERYITLPVEREMVRDGRVRVLRRLDEATSAGTGPKALAPTHVVQGYINSQTHADPEQTIRSIIVTMEASSVETNVKAWSHLVPIKKVLTHQP